MTVDAIGQLVRQPCYATLRLALPEWHCNRKTFLEHLRRTAGMANSVLCTSYAAVLTSCCSHTNLEPCPPFVD